MVFERAQLVVTRDHGRDGDKDQMEKMAANQGATQTIANTASHLCTTATGLSVQIAGKTWVKLSLYNRSVRIFVCSQQPPRVASPQQSSVGR